MNAINKNKASKANKADLLFHKAFIAHQAGHLAEAEALYRQVLQITPLDMETLYLLGTACSQRGRFDEAEKYLKRSLQIQPDHPEALNSLGMTLRGQKKMTEAIRCFRRAVDLKPEYVDALSNLGSALEVDGQIDEAEASLRKALALNPDTANVHYNLGLVLSARDQFELAAKHFLRGLELKPDFAPAYSDLGGIYKTWGRLDQALACLDRGVALAPETHFMRANRGAILEDMGHFDEALVEYELASRLNSDDNMAQWNMAYLFLRQGILDRGWEAHEMRLAKGREVIKRFPFPDWNGSALKDKTILIYAEQGLGDEIFYASCIPDMLAIAGHCIIECDVRLGAFYARSFPSATVIGSDRLDVGWLAAMPKIDVQVAVGGIPRFLRPALESFPNVPHYLLADRERVEYWRARVGVLGTGLKVGICWRSGLTTGDRHKFYSELSQWGAIFGVSGIHFVNLQYDECTEELREVAQDYGVTISTFPELDMRNELDETAALITSLDVVISAGTAVSEIAGALGVEIFRVDPFGKQMDALGTGSSPWHPRMRLFPQLSTGDWDAPLAQIAEVLKERTLGIETAAEYVPITTGIEIAVNGSLDDLNTYVLKEQQGWFDPEYAFVLAIAGPGLRIVDVGAGMGAYTIPLARKIGEGSIRAITQTAADVNLLMRSRTRNGFEKIVDIAIAHRAWSLDAEMDKHGLDGIAFLRVSQAQFDLAFLAGAERFLSTNSPLLMFGVVAGEAFDLAAAEWLIMRGYGLYRLVPELDLLVPFTSLDDLDIFALNLFACKPDRAALLAGEGVLIKQSEALAAFPGIDLKYWQDYMATKAYAVGRLDYWLGSQEKPADWEVYWMGLNLFAMAKMVNRPAVERYGALEAAASVLSAIVHEHANVPRLLSLCRVLAGLGKRALTVSVLNQVCDLLNTGMPAVLDEPYLALNTGFESVIADGRDVQWVVATVLAQRENMRAFSTYFTGDEALPVLEEVRAAGFGSEEIERKIKLIEARFAVVS